ncbi:hypothetical protein ANCCEY_10447 [Ancylostoma ceylanicum]|uniref:Uncharacterized protein n=1 Tax=Ancylostoma ceylanicum TaxID=53326 RepID=A0A0D6LEE7_9BILA|nr:hypothetical protein ANCCEY_10447 [Ancylostoma ceylanicum]
MDTFSLWLRHEVGGAMDPMWWLLVLVPAALALNYRCQNNQVLVVQSFGNDTIRMHCQRLDMCGYQRLRCDYDEFQPQCGGLMNFVAHVVQTSATSPSAPRNDRVFDFSEYNPEKIAVIQSLGKL